MAFLRLHLQIGHHKTVSAGEAYGVAAAVGAGEVPSVQLECMSAIRAAAGQGSGLQDELRAFGHAALGKDLEAAFQGLRLHTGDEAQLAGDAADAAHLLFRVGRIVVFHSFQGSLEQPLDKTGFVHPCFRPSAPCRRRRGRYCW